MMQVEQVKAFFILERDLAQEHGEMTATMKPKRKAMEVKYLESFTRLYNDRHFGVHLPMTEE
jgi:long-subunit acyl-CoA synthetase (AMP-forming)